MSNKLLPLLLVALISITIEVRGQDAKADLEKLQGDWSVTSMIRSEKDAPKKAIESIVVTFKGDKMTLGSTLEGGEAKEFTLKLDPAKMPRAMDLTPLDGPYKGKTGFGIYRFDGEDLKIYIANAENKARPTEFKSDAAGDYILITLGRKKK
jgi:uncharacterized protein (TIGR03067 family)